MPKGPLGTEKTEASQPSTVVTGSKNIPSLKLQYDWRGTVPIQGYLMPGNGRAGTALEELDAQNAPYAFFSRSSCQNNLQARLTAH